MDRDFSKLSEYAVYIPCYDNGNAVKAVLKDGSMIVIGKSIKSVIKNIQRKNNIDIGLIKKNFGEYIGRKNIIPIPIDIENILIPVKVRKAVAVNDGSFAYVNLTSIENVLGDKKASIVLSCGKTLDVLESSRTVLTRIEMGRIVRDKFASVILGENSIKDAFQEVAVEYNKPATRGDIALIARELMLIKSKLNIR
jgi:hypothetical protein